MAVIKKQFDEAMMNIYRRAKAECGYNAEYFHQMLCDRRGLATAQYLLASRKISDGFTNLWELGRLDLTVECLVLSRKFSGLFTDDELNCARKRLRDYGYDPDKCAK